ncbi:MAG: RNA polymerase sporulation sigma factor SigK [Oscillospiraceae bacterium]|nr:RNA polymerase sporulation sigma factor SigK [Oscillospiraceae bacterium]
MIETAWMLLLGSVFLMLRTSPTGSFPRPLSKDEERECLERMAQGDAAARDRLVEHDLRLVAHIVKKYYAQTDDVDDLISIGTIGLIKGIDTYNPRKGVKLSSYVSRCIENEVLMYFRGLRKRATDVSLSEALDLEDDGNGLSVLDVLAEEEDLAERIGNEELCGTLRKAVDSVLTQREAQIVRLRYGLDGRSPLTQREVADRCHISRSYVSRIEKRALERLREALGEDARP